MYEFRGISKRVEAGIQNMVADWWTFENLSAPTFGTMNGKIENIVLDMVKIGDGLKTKLENQ